MFFSGLGKQAHAKHVETLLDFTRLLKASALCSVDRGNPSTNKLHGKMKNVRVKKQEQLAQASYLQLVQHKTDGANLFSVQIWERGEVVEREFHGHDYAEALGNFREWRKRV